MTATNFWSGADLYTVRDFDQLDKIYESLSIEEKEIKTSLEDLDSTKTSIECQLKKMQIMLPNLDLLQQDAKNLGNMIGFTSTLAEGVSGKVRQVDLAKNRVSECMQCVEDILDLKSCTDGVQTALREEDYETAAAHIHRFLTLDEDILRMTADASEGSTLETSFQMLRDSEVKLKTIVHRHFDSAVHAGDRPSIERFFKLFPLLNLHVEGLEKFGRHLCAAVSEQCDSAFKINSVSDSPVKYADILTVIFENIAKQVEMSQPLVETYYGPGRLLTLLVTLQKECDRQSRKLLEEFRSKRGYDRLVNQVQQQHKYSQAQPTDQQQVDPRDLDPLLSELVLMNTRTELYLRFLRRRAEADLATTDGDVTAQKNELDKLTNGCQLSRLLQELLGHYVLLEEYFMRKMLDKAVQLDSSENVDSLTSSMLDDAFFVVRKCVRRAASSGSVDGVCALLNLAEAAVVEQLGTAMAVRLKSGFPSGWAQVLREEATAQRARQNFLRNLNNIQMSSEHVSTVKSSLEAELQSIHQLASESAREKLSTCLQQFSLGTTQKFNELLDSGFVQLTETVLRPQCKTFLQPFQSASYVLSEQELGAYAAQDPWMETLVVSIDNLLAGFKVALTPGNSDRLIQLLATELVLRLEKILLRKAFNRLGGLQLDRELRILMNYLTSATTWSIRDRFARLSQASILLNLEKPEEVSDYWGSRGITWRLTPAEVRQIMALRQDFKTDEIRKLKL